LNTRATLMSALEIVMNRFGTLVQIGLAVLLGAALGGCVIRPLDCGDRGNHGRDDRHQMEPDHGRSSGGHDGRNESRGGRP
jgi:hypothetical protein